MKRTVGRRTKGERTVEDKRKKTQDKRVNMRGRKNRG